MRILRYMSGVRAGEVPLATDKERIGDKENSLIKFQIDNKSIAPPLKYQTSLFRATI